MLPSRTFFLSVSASGDQITEAHTHTHTHTHTQRNRHRNTHTHACTHRNTHTSTYSFFISMQIKHVLRLQIVGFEGETDEMQADRRQVDKGAD